MKYLKLIDRRTKKEIYVKEISKIKEIKTDYKNIKIYYHNGLCEIYKKSFTNIVIV